MTARYLIRYSLGARNEYVYPPAVEGIVWQSVVYHATDRVMVGTTDAPVKADGKKVLALNPARADKLSSEFRNSYPKPNPTLHAELDTKAAREGGPRQAKKRKR